MVLLKSRKSRIVILGILTGLMCCAELVLGIISRSIALTADAFHMTSDLIALIVAWTAIHIRNKQVKSVDYTYGLQRSEVIGAFTNAIFLFALCFTILLQAIERFINMEPIREPFLVLYIGCAGLVINLLGLVMFHDHGHHHHADHGAHLNIRGIFLHVLGDALGSCGVIISALVIEFTNLSWKYYVDPIISLLIVIIIVTTTIPLVKSAGRILLQVSPTSVQIDKVRDDILLVSKVRDIHDLHVWVLSDLKIIATVHVMLDQSEVESNMIIAKQIQQILHSHGIHSCTVQIEVENGNTGCTFKCDDDTCLPKNCCNREQMEV